jgi:hypothetical protein
MGVFIQLHSNLFYQKFLKKSNRSALPLCRETACLAEKFSLHFLILRAPVFSSKRKRKFFCSAPRSTARGGGLSFVSGAAEFSLKLPLPPRPRLTTLFAFQFCAILKL